MRYTELIQKTINYIDDHIQEKISVETLAEIAGFSTYHFYRVFGSMVGLSVMEYVMKRKLQFALYELVLGKKVIDVAMNYGFETHAGFTKAFKRCYGCPPSDYRSNSPSGIPQRIDLTRMNRNKNGGVIKEPMIIERPAFHVVGYEFRNNLQDVLHTRDIPAFWSQRGLDDGACESKLYSVLRPVKHGEYCICINTKMDTDDFSFLMGVEVIDYGMAEENMYRLEIPSATYAVFNTPPVDKSDFVDSIAGTWKYIFEEWFPNHNFEIDDNKYEFEFYDERCHTWENDKLSMEIYVPIKAMTTERVN